MYTHLWKYDIACTLHLYPVPQMYAFYQIITICAELSTRHFLNLYGVSNFGTKYIDGENFMSLLDDLSWCESTH